MKRSLLLLQIILVSALSFAQSPNYFNYQAVVRNSTGDLVTNEDVNFKLSILEGTSTGTAIFSETQIATSNDYGLCNLKIGNGTNISGSIETVNWGSNNYYLKVEIDITGGDTFSEIGTVQLLSVPYALYAQDVANKDDADADATNEIQDISLTGTELSITSGSTVDLSLIQDGVDDADADATNEIQDLNLTSNVLTITNNATATAINLAPYTGTNTDEQTLTLDGDTLEISNGNSIVFPYDSSRWAINGDKMYYNTGNVGIGTSNPNSKLEVQADASFTENDTLFAVKDKDGNIVFAVFPDGAKVYVNDGAKGTVGGFAVSGRNPAKATIEENYFKVTPDSTRVWVNESTKGTVGGFAVSGRNPAKSTILNYFVSTADSTRVYINDTSTSKGTVGGFAVSGRNPAKGDRNDYFISAPDSTRVYVNEGAKGTVGGFAVSGRNPAKGTTGKFMDMTKDNYFIGHESGQKNTTGLYNSFFGYEAGLLNTEGNQGVFMGYKAGSLNTTGDNNTFIGNYAGFNNSTGYENVFIGDSAGASSTTAYWNVFIGEKSGISNTSGYSNTFIGEETGKDNTTGRMNAFIGTGCGYSNTTGYKNSFLGSYCGFKNTEGFANVFVGSTAGMNNTIGTRNVFIGQAAGYYIQEASYNIFIGNQSGAYAVGGENNVFLGTNSGHRNISGNDNVFLGTNVGQLNTVAHRNTVLGAFAADSDTLGDENVILGYQSGQFSRGAYNIMLGSRSGQVSTGSFNIMIGQSAGRTTTGASQNIFIGRSAGWFEQNSNRLIIETSEADETGALIYGEFDVDYLRFNARVGIGTRAESDANLLVNDESDLATIKVRGTGDTYNYSRIVLESNEGTNKFWQLAHNKDNDFGLVYNDGSTYFSRFKVNANGGASLYYGDLQVDSAVIANKIESSGGFIAGLNSINGDYTITENDYTVLVSTSSTEITINLPLASLVENQIFIIKKIDLNLINVIIEPDGIEQIDSLSDYTLSNQNDAITVQSNGSNWFIIGKIN